MTRGAIEYVAYLIRIGLAPYDRIIELYPEIKTELDWILKFYGFLK